MRTCLTMNTTFYVRNDGSNSNDGSANDSAHAWLTLQYASDYIKANVDLSGFDATIQVGQNGTYDGVQVLRPYTGGGWVIFSGDTGTPSNIVINSNIGFQATYHPSYKVQGFKLAGAGMSRGFHVSGGGLIWLSGNMEFGQISTANMDAGHLFAQQGGTIILNSNYTITGGSFVHLWCSDNSTMEAYQSNVTVSGTPNFTGVFAFGYKGGVILHGGGTNSFSGSATGGRYLALLNGGLDTQGGGANYFPGNSGGSTGSGGWYN